MCVLALDGPRRNLIAELDAVQGKNLVISFEYRAATLAVPRARLVRV
jgi:hypothetical protein